MSSINPKKKNNQKQQRYIYVSHIHYFRQFEIFMIRRKVVSNLVCIQIVNYIINCFRTKVYSSFSAVIKVSWRTFGYRNML